MSPRDKNNEHLPDVTRESKGRMQTGKHDLLSVQTETKIDFGDSSFEKLFNLLF